MWPARKMGPLMAAGAAADCSSEACSARSRHVTRGSPGTLATWGPGLACTGSRNKRDGLLGNRIAARAQAAGTAEPAPAGSMRRGWPRGVCAPLT